VLTTSALIWSQQNIPVSIKLKDAFILSVDATEGKLLVDLGDNVITTDESVKVNINSKTNFLDKKKKPVDIKLLRPGVLLEIEGQKLGTDVTADRVTVLTNLQDWEVTVAGYFEKLDGDTAEIDGQRIKLETNAKIKGADEWKSRDFNSFNDMMLGSEARVEGVRKSDGIVYAARITTKPNSFTKSEKELRLKLSQNLNLTGVEVDAGAVKQLSNGNVEIGGKKFKLVESLEVQTYVNKVGFKLVPRYIKDLDRNDPSKLSFRFYAVEDPTPNAFAFADGSVFIHTGLLKILKNEAQLAGVIGHEMAHATYEHSRRTNESLLVKVPVVGEKLGVLSKGDLVTFGLGVFANKFSRDMENEADRVGLRYMFDAGYDPRESPKVWRELSKLTQTNSIETFLYSSHPEATARLKSLNREIAYNYYDTDFSKTLVKTDEYMAALGLYFGWIKKPERPKATPTPAPTKPATTAKPTPTPRPTKPKRRP
jgi:hypothetical protein